MQLPALVAMFRAAAHAAEAGAVDSTPHAAKCIETHSAEICTKEACRAAKIGAA